MLKKYTMIYYILYTTMILETNVLCQITELTFKGSEELNNSVQKSNRLLGLPLPTFPSLPSFGFPAIPGISSFIVTRYCYECDPCNTVKRLWRKTSCMYGRCQKIKYIYPAHPGRTFIRRDCVLNSEGICEEIWHQTDFRPQGHPDRRYISCYFCTKDFCNDSSQISICVKQLSIYFVMFIILSYLINL